ncbi:MAG: alpha/beta hydrolase [Gammaproteobacteria bacterium]|nr:alpha/beta hydrolase [Gammaproteobacteria bacterium]
MKRVILCHRWGGSPDSVWYPWAQRELERQGFNVEIPAMPDPDQPRLERWLPALSDAVGNPDAHTILVGHSLGCANILRYLEQLGGEGRVGGAVLVAGFADSMNNEEIASFFETPFDYTAIRSRCRAFVAIHSNDDPAAAPDYLRHAMGFMDSLRARVVLIPGGGHFSEGEGCTELPDVILAVEYLGSLRDE